MNCEHCNSDNLNKKFLRSSKVQARKTKRYFRYCRSCGYNSYYSFPEYLPESQFDKYIEQINKKGDYAGRVETEYNGKVNW